MDTSEKRLKIIAAAEDVVSEKGLNDSTIAEIAATAGLSDAVIYQCFKGKEDIVFSIPAERENEFLSLLSQHLQGIEDPESQLRKTIWFYIWYCEMNPKYAKILYFDCLSSVHFYQSRGYKIIRQYAKTLLACLEKGAEEGKFRRDVDMHLIRDMVLGMIGCEMVTLLTVKGVDSVVTDLEDMISLILGMLKPAEETEEVKIDRILNASERIFAQNGFYRSRVAEIAKLAEVAEGTVYEYFGSKEELLFAIPDRHLRNFMNSLPEIFQINNPIRKLRRFTEYYFSIFSRQDDFLKVFLLQIQLSRQFYETEQFRLYVNFLHVSEEIIEEGISIGCFRPDVNPRVFRNLFIGTFNNMALSWFVVQGDRSVDKMKKIDEVADLLCLAVIASDKRLLCR